MNNRFQRKPLVAALLASLIATGPVLADSAIHEQISVVPGRQITPKDEAAISSTAVKVLRHIAEARGALQGETPDLDKARAQLQQSDRLLDIIQASVPTTRIKDRIWVAKKHLEYENTEEVLPDLVPIYASLEELVDYVPTAKAKTHLDNAKQALKKGDKPKAVEQLQAADDALLYVEADLPLSGTRSLVNRAKSSLDKQDAASADQALAVAEDSVVYVSMSFQSPLTQAKAALYRAWQESELGERAFAKADLNAAVRFLEQAARSDDKLTREQAGDLVSEVRDLHSIIDDDNGAFSSRLETAWHRVKAMSERSAEQISTGWQRFRADDGVKKDLIDAKLQVSLARIDRFKANDAAAAKVELAEARAHLDTALKQASDDKRDAVKAVSTQVADLEKSLDSGNSQQGDSLAFGQVESRLGELIHQL